LENLKKTRTKKTQTNSLGKLKKSPGKGAGREGNAFHQRTLRVVKNEKVHPKKGEKQKIEKKKRSSKKKSIKNERPGRGGTQKHRKPSRRVVKCKNPEGAKKLLICAGRGGDVCGWLGLVLVVLIGLGYKDAFI